MLGTWSLLAIKIALPLLVFFNQPLLPFQSQQVLGIFGSEYRDYYNSCIEKSGRQAREITQLTAALKEAETKLNDVDIYRESIKQREEFLKNREESLKNRQIAVDGREQLLEQRTFDFTKKLEEVSRNGGKAEQILANNEMLKGRVYDLESQLNEERVFSEKKIEKEREFSRKSLEDERRTNQVLLILGAVMIVTVLSFIGGIGFLYFRWTGRGIDTPQTKVVDTSPAQALDAKTVALKQSNEALPPGSS